MWLEEKANQLRLQRSQTFSKARSQLKYLDTNQYQFVHKEGHTFCGTRAEFCEKFNIGFKRITELINGKRLTYLGWTI